MTIIFKYRKEQSAITGIVYRPVAEVILITKEGRVSVPMYIDSGADITLLPRLFGEALGFKVDKLAIIELSGIGKGRVPVIIKPVRMIIGEFEIEARIAWALIEDIPPLLGRADVFDEFDIEFKQREGNILFEKVGSQK